LAVCRFFNLRPECDVEAQLTPVLRPFLPDWLVGDAIELPGWLRSTKRRATSMKERP